MISQPPLHCKMCLPEMRGQCLFFSLVAHVAKNRTQGKKKVLAEVKFLPKGSFFKSRVVTFVSVK